MEAPVLYRYQGLLNGAIIATERATTGLSWPGKDLQNSGNAYSVSPAAEPRFTVGKINWSWETFH